MNVFMKKKKKKENIISATSFYESGLFIHSSNNFELLNKAFVSNQNTK
jgi:hypothetical protein